MALLWNGAELTIEFCEAYLHKSNGRPGHDPGTGWVQQATLTFSQAVLSGEIPPLPCLLIGGEMQIDGQKYELLPVPFEKAGSVRFELVFGYNAQTIEISGGAVRATVLGEPKFVEENP